TSATPIRFLSRSMLRISKAAVVPTETDRVQPFECPVGAKVEACASPSTPGSSSTNAPKSVRRVTRPGRTWPTSYVVCAVDQGSAVSCFNPSDLLRVVVHAQDFHGD